MSDTPVLQTHATTTAVTENLLVRLAETFERLGRIYLDEQAGFFETLDALSAEQASSPVLGTTIAAQVFHTAFYIQTLERYLKDASAETDWRESWTTRSVTREQWDALRTRLQDDYACAVQQLREAPSRGDDKLEFALDIVIHSAYHLGAIRQLVKAVKKETI